MTHLYIHIPFCQRRCAYCDFNTYAHSEQHIAAYVDALCAELGMLVALRPPPSASPEAAALGDTIFFGGGTPTMLSLKQFERILAAATPLVPLEHAEISCEANPGTVLNLSYLRGLRSLGINRLSLGVQSLDDATLRRLGRIHSAAEAQQSYTQARQAGFTHVNLDLIFGLPTQSLEQWQRTLTTIATWQAEHLALYALTVEEATPLHAQVASGQLAIPDDDATATMYEVAMESLAAAGYLQYEISNWGWGGATPGVSGVRGGLGPPRTPDTACRHNLAYWLNSDYLAAGAGAHGHGYPQRYANLRAIGDYIAAVQAGTRPVGEALDLTPHDLYAETMLMGMRLNMGVSASHFAARCGRSLDATYGPVLAELVAQGLIERTAERVYLTPRGRMLANQVCMRFLYD
ncbi:MAG: radical SAM family heme chaperone HemW [Candidatus Viridilinea halotolerans]|uniref:Heme chaperone HemW n=1 Tax=Candidatus Viridilinea halotolerans TaxID=2491704 RepID=A0A426TQU1_9CHLR|nr:MAG: radical SAM family heme chaperone HemW [Candidatus Viridilinea halotolerans]